jgi:hypothetical protein
LCKLWDRTMIRTKICTIAVPKSSLGSLCIRYISWLLLFF